MCLKGIQALEKLRGFEPYFDSMIKVKRLAEYLGYSYKQYLESDICMYAKLIQAYQGKPYTPYIRKILSQASKSLTDIDENIKLSFNLQVFKDFKSKNNEPIPGVFQAFRIEGYEDIPLCISLRITNEFSRTSKAYIYVCLEVSDYSQADYPSKRKYVKELIYLIKSIKTLNPMLRLRIFNNQGEIKIISFEDKIDYSTLQISPYQNTQIAIYALFDYENKDIDNVEDNIMDAFELLLPLYKSAAGVPDKNEKEDFLSQYESYSIDSVTGEAKYYKPQDNKSDDDSYSNQDFLDEVYQKEEVLDDLCDILIRKKTILIGGPSGVGKSFISLSLAYALLNKRDYSHVFSVQMCESYSYSNFIQGVSEQCGRRIITNGLFYDFCLKAIRAKNEKFFFIMDNINFVDLASVFGDVFSLLEGSHRNQIINLSVSKESFYVPDNLFIIGVINSSSDKAFNLNQGLQRMFGMYTLHPDFDSPGFIKYQKEFNWPLFDKLISIVKSINKEIEEDPELEHVNQICPSLLSDLIGNCSVLGLGSIVKYEVLPLLSPSNSHKLDKYIKALKEIVKATGVKI